MKRFIGHRAEVIPCRGRDGGRETKERLGCIEDQLDTLAPRLTPVQQELVCIMMPPDEVLEVMRQRIKAAHWIKYGASE